MYLLWDYYIMYSQKSKREISMYYAWPDPYGWRKSLKVQWATIFLKMSFFYPPIKIPLAKHFKDIRYLQGKYDSKIQNGKVKKWQINLEHRNTISKIISPNCVKWTEIFLRFETDLDLWRPWFSEIKVQFERTPVLFIIIIS